MQQLYCVEVKLYPVAVFRTVPSFIETRKLTWWALWMWPRLHSFNDHHFASTTL